MIDMAKKTKVTIINQELTPTVLAVKEDKRTVSMIGFLWITLIFVIFVAAVLYLPEVSTYLKKYLNYLPFINIDIDDEENPVIIPNEPTPETPEEKQNNETNENEQQEEKTFNGEHAYLIVDNKVLAISKFI
jgi:hypothetical protein